MLWSQEGLQLLKGPWCPPHGDSSRSLCGSGPPAGCSIGLRVTAHAEGNCHPPDRMLVYKVHVSRQQDSAPALGEPNSSAHGHREECPESRDQ